MIVTAIQCEMCPNAHQMGKDDRVIPDGWLFIAQVRKEDLHFCSHECLARWAGVVPAQPISGPLEAPATKMRRFLLVDGETAEETEGVMWGTGQVSLDGLSPHCRAYHCEGNFHTWDALKETHPGDGVTWIDQEVREEVSCA